MANGITGNAGANLLDGGHGADRLLGLGGADTLFGGAGNDVLAGAAENDRIVGSAGTDTLDGGGGADMLLGGAGDDSLVGGVGRDVLRGDAGADTLVVNLPGGGAAEADLILGFDAAGSDLLVLDLAIGLGVPLGSLAPGAFLANLSGQATTAAARLVYETDRGLLWFDVDGSGAASRMLVARLDGAPALSAADIVTA